MFSGIDNMSTRFYGHKRGDPIDKEGLEKMLLSTSLVRPDVKEFTDKLYSSKGNDELNISDLMTRLYDIEHRMPKKKEPTSNEVIMKFLKSSATLGDVVSAINELIKRDLTLNEVE